MATVTSAVSTQHKMECQPCGRDNKIIDASFWCKDCKESICDDCASFHIKLRLNHSMVPKDEVTDSDILVSQLDLVENCQKHKKEPLTMYCIKDEDPCCTICALSTHKACQDVVPLDELAETYSDQIKENDAKCLQTMKKSLENIIKVTTAVQEENDNSANDMVCNVTELVATIKQQMDGLLNSFISVIQEKKSESLATSNKQLEMLEEFGQKLKDHSETMELFNYMDPRQSLIASFMIKKDLSDQVRILEENSLLYKCVQLKFKVVEMISQKQNVKSLVLITDKESPSTALSDINKIRIKSRSLQHGLIPTPSPQVALAPNHSPLRQM